MNIEERIEQQQLCQHYLESKGIYQILQNAIESLLIQQPTNPIDFIISHLSEPHRKIILLIGPPGLHLYRIAQKSLSESDGNRFIAFNCGQYVQKHKAELEQQSKELFNESRLILNQKINAKILDQVTKFCKQNPNTIIEGFPKNIGQAISFQNKSLIPDKVIFVNVDKTRLHELCRSKISQNSSANENEIQQKTTLAVKQYQINLKDLKQYYPRYLEINATHANQQRIGKDISKCLGLHFGQLNPRKNTRIVVVGAPFSGRTTLGKKIATKYNLIYVSTAVLIAEEIRKGFATGRKIQKFYTENKPIDNFTVEKLLQERISQKDCQMQGYVIEGYPKNKEQLESLKNLHIHPNFIIGISPSQRLITSRIDIDKHEDFQNRFGKWLELEKLLKEEKQIFWVNPQFDIENSFEEVCFEIENRKI